MSMAVAFIGIVLGVGCTWLDLGSRLFGSYRRTVRGAAARIATVVAACLVLVSPLIVLASDPTSAAARIVSFLFGTIGYVECVHFLWPYRWRVRRVKVAFGGYTAPLADGGMVLKAESLAGVPLPLHVDSVTILILSDLHCNSRQKLTQLQEAVAKLVREQFDLIFLLGDFGENAALLPEVMAALAQLSSRYGHFCVRGNHDFERGRDELVAELLAENHIELLSNRFVQLPETDISLVGLEWPWRKLPSVVASPAKFLLALTHTPDDILWLSQMRAAITFAGHTHGGRLRLPLFGPMLVPCRLGRFLDSGWFTRNGSLLRITPGVGYFPRSRRPGEFYKLTLYRVGRDLSKRDT